MFEPRKSDPRKSDALPEVPIDEPRHREAFAVADELNVHGAGCVCPRCAGRLPGLLTELAHALGRLDDESAR